MFRKVEGVTINRGRRGSRFKEDEERKRVEENTWGFCIRIKRELDVAGKSWMIF
ncbi:hypothetical protein B4135_1613 [Caldibacillus debilis]|jgi:hypothetical protein|uniref:Uncharacterized protein n=1 Tax=Caldibacillus debilis TaxID=301148 RepID=A0A150MBN8_9BACI|nr:hypothetical protein B4135_1613 [Caldibacillus debilis]